MIARVPLLALLACVLATPLRATPREELLFKINTALKTRDGAGFARCFNFRGADDATREAFIKMISEILSWPSNTVFVSDRSGEGNPVIEQGGRAYVLNGDWKYQVHIFLSETSKKGYVFPAGRADGGEDLILLTIPTRVAPAPSKPSPSPAP